MKHSVFRAEVPANDLAVLPGGRVNSLAHAGEVPATELAHGIGYLLQFVKRHSFCSCTNLYSQH